MGKGKKYKGIQCNVTADPSAFRHGHFHFHHADLSAITLPGTGEPGRRGSTREGTKRRERFYRLETSLEV